MFITGSTAHLAFDDIKHCDDVLKMSKGRIAKKRFSNRNDFIWIGFYPMQISTYLN